METCSSSWAMVEIPSFAAQSELIEPGQILYSCADLPRMSLQGLPVDHIHGVIQKMWVDLGL